MQESKTYQNTSIENESRSRVVSSEVDFGLRSQKSKKPPCGETFLRFALGLRNFSPLPPRRTPPAERLGLGNFSPLPPRRNPPAERVDLEISPPSPRRTPPAERLFIASELCFTNMDSASSAVQRLTGRSGQSRDDCDHCWDLPSLSLSPLPSLQCALARVCVCV